MDSYGIDLEPALATVYGGIPEGATLTRLAGDASTRTYYRLDAPGRDPARLIVMHLPEDALGSDEGDGSERASELPFLNVQRMLSGRGVPVPRIFADDVPRRVVLLEDLGDETFEARLTQADRAAWPELYGRAVDLLADLHERCEHPEPGCLAWERGFDRALLRWELDHFRKWGLERPWGPLPSAARNELDALFDALADELAGLPPSFVHRDYQSRNLMWRGDELVVIDFQDALLGPRPYDLVALLCDSYVELGAELQSAMLERYVERRGIEDRAAFERTFRRVAVQRKLKDAGRFVFIDRVRGNPGFLQWYGRSLSYVGRALAQLPDSIDSARIDALLREHLPGFPDAVPTPPLATGDNVGES